MITGDSPFKAAPRISKPRFIEVMTDAGSPWADNAGAYYDLIVEHGHDPAVWLAICGREHSFATNRDSVLWRNHTNSWTNARSIRDPEIEGEIITDSVRRSQYVKYRSVADSLIDGMYRVDDPAYAYQQAGASTIREVLSIWTEAEATQYTAYVVDRLNEWYEEAPAMPLIPGLIDIRSQLQRNMSPGHGPNETRPLSDKNGIIIHYRGVVTDPNHQGISMIRADALYHVSRDWGQGTRGDGLMYHIEIGPNGEKYWCRDLDAVLWHCGSWPENATYWAVSIPIGPGQHATPQQIQSAWEVCDNLRAINDSPRANVKGHQEVSSTDCPGTLMDDFVHPYRAGEDQPVHDGALYIAGNPFGDIPIVLGFRDWFLTVGAARNPADPIAGGLSIVGYPVEPEHATDYGSSQRFERGVLRWERGVNPPFDIVLSLLSDVKAA